MNAVSSYILYMKSLATKHPAILHQDTEGAIAFAIDEFEDLLQGIFRDQIKPTGFSLRLVKPMLRPTTDEAAGLLAFIDSGFSVLKRLESLTEIPTAHTETAEITRQIIAKLISDSRAYHPLFAYSLNNLSYGKFIVEPVTFKGDGYFAGQLVTFQFQTEYIEDIDELVTATNWLP
jgi:hypothetical protein